MFTVLANVTNKMMTKKLSLSRLLLILIMARFVSNCGNGYIKIQFNVFVNLVTSTELCVNKIMLINKEI